MELTEEIDEADLVALDSYDEFSVRTRRAMRSHPSHNNGEEDSHMPSLHTLFETFSSAPIMSSRPQTPPDNHFHVVSCWLLCMHIIVYALCPNSNWNYERIAERLHFPLATVWRAAQRTSSPAPPRRGHLRLFCTPEKRRLRVFLLASPESRRLSFQNLRKLLV
jgi:hypothetical protein